MNILFILNIDMAKGGPSVHLLNDIINQSINNGHCVTRIEKKYGDDSWNMTHSKTEKEIRFCFECKEPHALNYAKRYLNDIRYAIKCKNVVKNKDFDLVFIQSCNTAAFQLNWIKKLKCPIIYNVQDVFPLDIYYEGVLKKYNPIYVVMDILQKYAYKKATHIITISEDIKETLISLKVDKNKISVVYNWAYNSNYSIDEEKYIKENYYCNNKFNVVYAGNIGIAQSVETLIEAAAYLREKKDIMIQIFGKGSRKDRIEERIKELKLENVEMHDLVPQQYSQYVYHLADINIVTLIKGIMKTSLPSKTAACYNSQKPVIYCIEKNCKTIMKMRANNEMIFQCAPQSPKELADLILKIYDMDLSYGDTFSAGFVNYSEVMKPQSAISYVEIFEKEYSKRK